VSHSRREDPFSELFGEFSDRLRGDRWRPDVDVFETEKDVVVRVELAGVHSDDVRVTVDGDVLRIRGARRAPEPGDLRRLHQMEIASGPFERQVRVPIAFDRDSVTAHLADGFLTVTLRKREPVRRRVEIAGKGSG
jgi:HSP20 family protein